MNHAPAYHRYLYTWQWRFRRRLRLLWAGHKCENCGSRKGLQAHHLTYERLYHERISDLQILCEVCHPLADAQRRYDKALQTYCVKRWGPMWVQVVRPDEAKAEFDKWLTTKQEQ
jgi:5-methylcytosine-specific restriction endonuclease McrA